MSTVRAARYRRLALLEPDKEKSRILQLLAEEAERGILCPVDRPSNSTVLKTRQTDLQRSLMRNGTSSRSYRRKFPLKAKGK
jgi:hypothetical protein